MNLKSNLLLVGAAVFALTSCKNNALKTTPIRQACTVAMYRYKTFQPFTRLLVLQKKMPCTLLQKTGLRFGNFLTNYIKAFLTEGLFLCFKTIFSTY